LLTRLHHPLHHVLHSNRRLTGSCKCHSDWLVQTAVEAADAEEHETKGLGTDVLVLVLMVLDRMPDAKESDAELQVQCHIELV